MEKVKFQTSVGRTRRDLSDITGNEYCALQVRVQDLTRSDL